MDISIFFFLICLVQTLPLSSSNTFDTLTGTSLSVDQPSDILVSANGEFSAGFFPVGDNAFCFSIWMTRPSVPTIVWMANRDDPVDGKGSKLSVLNEGKLILTNSVGITVWTTRTSALTSSEATNLQLQLLNTGNLVLHNSKSNFFIWQSFDSPTDTLLPQQALTMVSSLISKRSQDDYSSGNYKLFFDNDNVLRLLFQGPAMTSLYWPDPWIEDPGEVGRSKYNTSRNALLDDLGCFWSSDHFTFFANDYGVVTHRRLTLDPDGNLRLYSLKEMNGRWDWVVTWQVLSQPCTIHGICGPNSLCSYDHVFGRRCSCLQGFKMKDNTDWSYGCEPEFSVSCNHTDESSFVQLEHVEYYGSDLNFTKNLTFELCQEKCWSFGCNCKGFQYKFIKEEGIYYCYPKFLLINGHYSPNFVGDFYLRVPKDGIFYNKTPHEEFKLACSGQIPKQQRRTYENKTVKLLLWFAIALGGVELTCIVMVWFFLLRTRKRPDPAAQGYLLTNRFQRFSFDELRKATRGFKEVIGQGAGGIVYKGVLPDQRVAAIKRLNEANQGESEFLAEVNTIGMLNHMYLIEMWGYCAEGKHKLLVYEYMEHGSLAGNLRSNVLDWKKRFDIAVGTAKGLAYLHEECLEWVLHCDVKPQNILLDANYQPKVADFGLSKLLSRSNIDHSSFSKMRGTRGYMAPEWVYNLPITSKVDVYSYGIVLLEMVTGKSPSGMHISDNGGTREHKRLVTLVRENLDIENDITMSWIEEIIDPMMAGIYDKAKMELLVTVALQCVAEDKDDRPTMNQVVEMLLSHED
uniref:Receptor-like serine/threonine-protein kinase n=1 Tax=Fagus sylvatica TaxID=28930 RepID=A0A2N9GBL1_FAGSY